MADEGFTPQVEWILRHITGTAPDDAVLGDARWPGRPPRPPATSTDPVDGRHRLGHRDGRHDAPRVPRRAPHGQGQGDRLDRRTVTRTVVFCPTKRACDRATEALEDLRCQAAAIHGDLPQPLREKALKSLLGRRARRARGHRRRRPRHRRRRHRRRDPLRAGHRPQVVPAPLGPHGPGRARRLGGDAGRVQPAPRRAGSSSASCGCRSQSRSRSSPTTIGWSTCTPSPRSRPRGRQRLTDTGTCGVALEDR